MKGIMRFAFYVSGGATRLIKTLILLEKTNVRLAKKIKFVFIDNCNSNSLRETCKRLGIQVYEFDARAFEKASINKALSEKLLGFLQKEKIDYGFVFGRRILTGKILKAYKQKLINFHPSLLPIFKGIKAIDRALKEKTFLLGNSAHFINESVDEGEVIMQSILSATLFGKYDDVLDMQINMLIQIMLWLEENRIVVKDGYVNVKNAQYEISQYIPNLEFTAN